MGARSRNSAPARRQQRRATPSYLREPNAGASTVCGVHIQHDLGARGGLFHRGGRIRRGQDGRRFRGWDGQGPDSFRHNGSKSLPHVLFRGGWDGGGWVHHGRRRRFKPPGDGGRPIRQSGPVGDAFQGFQQYQQCPLFGNREDGDLCEEGGQDGDVRKVGHCVVTGGRRSHGTHARLRHTQADRGTLKERDKQGHTQGG